MLLKSNKQQIGSIKVEYAFETARMRLFLPLRGETWFFIDQKMTLKDFKEQCQEEDSLVTDIKFLDSANKELRNEDALSLYSILTTDKNQLRVQINENVQQFTGVQSTVVSHKADQWFEKCTKIGLNPT